MLSGFGPSLSGSDVPEFQTEDEDPTVKDTAEAALRVTKGNREFGARYEVLDLFDI